VHFFFTERDSDLSAAEREICIKIANLCSDDQFVAVTEPDRNPKEAGDGGAAASASEGASASDTAKSSTEL
jgi:hypothetical protein